MEGKDHFKVHYFGGNARAAIARAILSATKADWENIIVDFKDWPQLKASGLCEFGQLPVIDHNGKLLVQSMAFDIYLAKYLKLYPESIELQYQIESLLCSFEDVFTPFHSFVYPVTQFEKDNVEMLKKMTLDKYKMFIQVTENRYNALGKGKYFLGEQFTLADIYVCFAIFYFMPHVDIDEKTVKEMCPSVFELIERIKANDLKEFYEKYYYDKKM